MNRGPLRAALALLQLVLLLGLQLAEGTGVHRCPEHDAGLGPGPASSGHELHAMAGHAHHGAPSSHESHGACRCLGACCAATMAARSPEPPAVALALVQYHAPASSGVVLPRDSVRLLPFAIGPPQHA